eukprot:TRINITY_DN1500_c0_g1_i2.p1 TRINITY_DN1500_c0_g1~~TRINITY_DN1500_c0_g1_i2.p1  ORF type:complete len:479 (+),score=170.04 TRINITY_DN1500_c0_g1_i2:91-1437(+)
MAAPGPDGPDKAAGGDYEESGGAESPPGSPRETRMCSRNWAAFWWLGMINNMPYVVILAGAKKIADKYDEKNLMPILTWALVAFGFIVSNINAFLLPGKPYPLRFSVWAVGTATGLVLVGLSSGVGNSGGAHFGFAVFGTVLLGSSCSFGESVALGYMHRFPKGMVGGWSAGTGMSGVVGSGLWLGLYSAGLTVEAIMFLTTGAVLVHIAAFSVGIKEPPAPPGGACPRTAAGDCPESCGDCPESCGQDALLAPPERPTPPPITWARLSAVNALVFDRVIQMYLVYVCEYTVQNAASYVQPCTYRGQKVDDSDDWLVKNFYTLTQFAYQSGVLVSRSSLACVRIRRVELLSAAQFVNMGAWLMLAKTKWLGQPPYLYLLLPAMFFVGLLGGASYVNVFHLIQSDSRLSRADVELAMNVGGLYVNVGIMSGCLTVLVFANTVLHGEKCS